MTVSSSPNGVNTAAWSLITYIGIPDIFGGLDPFHFVADLVDRIHQGANIPCHIVKKVNGRHDELAADRVSPANIESIIPKFEGEK